MKKVRLFPGIKIIGHTVPFVVVFVILGVTRFAELTGVAIALGIAVSLISCHGLGMVVVTPGQLISYRLTGRKVAVTPDVVAVDVDMIRRRVYAWFYVNYYYPVLTLASGKTIRLPIAVSSRARATKTVSFLRSALAVPAPGSVPIPQGRIAQALAGTGRPKRPSAQSDSFNPMSQVEGFSID